MKEAKQRRIRPALTPEARQDQLIAMAVDCAERQLLEGTASSQVITHFLKLGSTNAKLEEEKLRNENLLLQAKVESIKAQQRSEEMFEKAIAAMKCYSGGGGTVVDDEEQY